MEQDDEEFEQLLCEIPRATSAPPHLDDLHRARNHGMFSSPPEATNKGFDRNKTYDDLFKRQTGAEESPDRKSVGSDASSMGSGSENASSFYAHNNSLYSEKNGSPNRHLQGSSSDGSVGEEIISSTLQDLSLEKGSEYNGNGRHVSTINRPRRIGPAYREEDCNGITKSGNGSMAHNTSEKSILNGFHQPTMQLKTKQGLIPVESIFGLGSQNNGAIIPDFYTSRASVDNHGLNDLNLAGMQRVNGISNGHYFHSLDSGQTRNFMPNVNCLGQFQPQLLQHYFFTPDGVVQPNFGTAESTISMGSRQQAFIHAGGFNNRKLQVPKMKQNSLGQLNNWNEHSSEGAFGAPSRVNGCNTNPCSCSSSSATANLNDMYSEKIDVPVGSNNARSDTFQQKVLLKKGVLFPGRSLFASEIQRKAELFRDNKHVAASSAEGLVKLFFPSSQSHIQSSSNNIEVEIPSYVMTGLMSQHAQSKVTTMEEVKGRVYSMAKDQHGCRFLQRKFEEGSPEDIESIFREIVDHISELMVDPFGNYLVQKLLEVCSESQRNEILQVVTAKGQLVQISLSMHGTRAVQKLVETLKPVEQVTMVTSALKPGVVSLIKDLNGNHVIQRCLQRLSNDDNQFIFEAASSHCVEIATHRHGCCVLQRCVDFAKGAQKHRLIMEIASNALTLSQDAYGNYVVQYVLDLKLPGASKDIIWKLKGNYPLLALQKFSSNVVEKCLKVGDDESKEFIIRELVKSSCLNQLLHHEYANYVIQCALSVSKGSLHGSLVEAIRPHVPGLRNSPYGKRILSRTNLKK